jgi:hypothetical protein
MLRPIHAFMQHATGTSVEEFLSVHPDPVLLIAPFATEEDPKFNTVAGMPRPHEGGMSWVATVAKRPGSNVFTAMVTIGRARNNDIELNSSTVSKFHAYVTLEQEGPMLVDAGSTFGTFLLDHRLAPRRERHPLRSGDVVRIGSVAMTFLDARSFYAHLRREAESHVRLAG